MQQNMKLIQGTKTRQKAGPEGGYFHSKTLIQHTSSHSFKSGINNTLKWWSKSVGVELVILFYIETFF